MDKLSYQELDSIFHPGNMAIIGASPVSDLATLAHMSTKIKDRVYFVNPKYSEMLGKKCYATILDVPAPIDYVIIGVNAVLVPDILKACIEKAVKTVHIYTSGFSETGLPDGIELEKKLAEISRGKIRIIGPNCFGIYCPESGLAIVPESSEESGHVGVITQSGSVAESFSYFGRTKNLRFSKVVSYGNAIDLDCPDFLEYMADDPETRVIALYIEGSRDGKRLKDALTYAAGKKPVVAIKGGLTDNGSRVARSHTGQMTGMPQMWEALFRQCGVIQVHSHDELVNSVIAFSHSPLPKGNRCGIISNSGGFSVIQTDLCAEEGMVVPRFTDDTLRKLRELVPLAGTSIGNPLDAWPIFYKIFQKEGSLAEIVKAVASDNNIDSLVIMFDQFRYIRRVRKDEAYGHMKTVIDMLLEGSDYCRGALGKPVFLAVSLDPFLEDEIDRNANLMLKNAFEQNNYPVYPAADVTVRSLAKLYFYARRNGQILGHDVEL
ncbi:MAG: CoA-binding protein [Dehalococcoidia bacterium]